MWQALLLPVLAPLFSALDQLGGMPIFRQSGRNITAAHHGQIAGGLLLCMGDLPSGLLQASPKPRFCLTGFDHTCVAQTGTGAKGLPKASRVAEKGKTRPAERVHLVDLAGAHLVAR